MTLLLTMCDILGFLYFFKPNFFTCTHIQQQQQQQQQRAANMESRYPFATHDIL